jgi:hypothetical protein
MSDQKPWSMFDEPTPDGTPPLPAYNPAPTHRPTQPPTVGENMRVFRWAMLIRATMFDGAEGMSEALKPGFFGQDKGHAHKLLWIQTYTPVPRRLGVQVVLWTQSRSHLPCFTCDHIVLQSGEQVAALPDVTEHMHGKIQHDYGTITCQPRSKEQYVEAFSADHS